MPETPPETLFPAPYQISRQRNSLTGLPQYDKNQFIHGKHQHIATSHFSASAAKVVGAEGASIIEEDGFLESGGVELNIEEVDWFGGGNGACNGIK